MPLTARTGKRPMPKPCGCSTDAEAEAEAMGYGHVCAAHWTGPPTKAIWAAARTIAEYDGVKLDDQDDEVQSSYFGIAESALLVAHKAVAGDPSDG